MYMGKTSQKKVNERREHMSETQHTQQTATRTVQNQDTHVHCYKNTEDSQKQEKRRIGVPHWNGQRQMQPGV